MKAFGKGITDPRLIARVQAAMGAADRLAGDLRRDGSGPPSGPTPAIKTPPRRIRQSQKPLLNKLEQEYYHHGGLVNLTSPVSIQAIRFRLANGLNYKPDFFLWFPNRPAGIEVKGPHAFRGGFENLKMAAHQYPWIQWILVWKQDGVWQRQEVLP